jgi:hypothetical protein
MTGVALRAALNVVVATRASTGRASTGALAVGAEPGTGTGQVLRLKSALAALVPAAQLVVTRAHADTARADAADHRCTLRQRRIEASGHDPACTSARKLAPVL